MTNKIKKSFKATKMEILLRLAEIEDLLLARKSYREIVRYSTNQWGLTSRQTDKYIRAVKKQWFERTEKDYEKNFREAIKRREHLAELAMEEDDKKLVLEIEKDISKLNGLYVDRVENKGELTIKVVKEIVNTEKKVLEVKGDK